jgi:hypothetical protein
LLSLLLLLLLLLKGIEQSNLLQRLGPARLFNPAHPSCHWVLDLAHPGHEEVAKKLVGGLVCCEQSLLAGLLVCR